MGGCSVNYNVRVSMMLARTRLYLGKLLLQLGEKEALGSFFSANYWYLINLGFQIDYVLLDP